MARTRITPAIESPPEDRLGQMRRPIRRRVAYELASIALVVLSLYLLLH